MDKNIPSESSPRKDFAKKYMAQNNDIYEKCSRSAVIDNVQCLHL